MEKTETNLAQYLFHQGTNYRAQEYLGVNKENGEYVFRVWAPNAESVYLCGDFNAWDNSIPMNRITDGGIYEYRDTAGLIHEGERYKYKIINHGVEHLKGDPYARLTELPPLTASVVYTPDEYAWRDSGWLKFRHKNREKVYESEKQAKRQKLHFEKLRGNVERGQ